MEEFKALVPETSQFYEILNKIFRKKIKRAKVRRHSSREQKITVAIHRFGRAVESTRKQRADSRSNVPCWKRGYASEQERLYSLFLHPVLPVPRNT